MSETVQKTSAKIGRPSKFGFRPQTSAERQKDHRDTVNQQQLALPTAFREAVAALAVHDWALAKSLECREGVRPALERIDEFEAKKYRSAKLRDKAALKKIEDKASARRASWRRLKKADRPAHVPVIIRLAIRLPAEE